MKETIKRLLTISAFSIAADINPAKANGAAAGAQMMMFGETINQINKQTKDPSLVTQAGIPESIVKRSLRNNEDTTTYLIKHINNPETSDNELQNNGLLYTEYRQECLSKRYTDTANCIHSSHEKDRKNLTKNIMMGLGGAFLLVATGFSIRNRRTNENQPLNKKHKAPTSEI